MRRLPWAKIVSALAILSLALAVLLWNNPSIVSQVKSRFQEALHASGMGSWLKKMSLKFGHEQGEDGGHLNEDESVFQSDAETNDSKATDSSQYGFQNLDELESKPIDGDTASPKVFFIKSKDRQSKDSSKLDKLEKDQFQKFSTGQIICPLKAEPLLYVILALELRYKEPGLKSDLEFKLPNIKAIIQHVLYSRTRHDLKIPALRVQLIDGINGLLPEAKIEDVVFTHFQIEIRRP